ncbi:hypothetical protein F950_02729 [Acinetobacter soli NIPH 2899]|uniref:Uncharacterized protein n=1 Tax=Acinetobacter soli NIPH 2899 TaxID=1217677 RepID=A0ABN0JX20_9GAMM|nr:hypothetical protein F950_02729 [Acinetobacter soli NIPH 2899]
MLEAQFYNSYYYKRFSCIAKICSLSSLIASLEINPLYKNKGIPSSTSEFLKGVCPSRYSNIAIGYLSSSAIKNLFSLTITSCFANSCLRTLRNDPSFLLNEFNSLIRSASVSYLIFSFCLSLYVRVLVLTFLTSIFFGAVTRPIKKPKPKIIIMNINSPIISPKLYIGAF